MPSPGEQKTKFGRQFIFVNPDDNLGPGNWRLSTIDAIKGSGSSGGTVNVEIDGVAPIVANTDFITQKTEISMDLQQLGNREAT